MDLGSSVCSENKGAERITTQLIGALFFSHMQKQVL